MAAKAGAAASFMFMLFLLNIACQAQLSPAFYDSSCPNALSAIRTAIRSAIASDRRMAASLIRLHFHDCFVQPGESYFSFPKERALLQGTLVALSGSHTLGQAQCFTFRERIYNHSNIDAGFASTRRRRCPRAGSDSTLAPLDLVTPNSFDNNYFKNLMQNKGLLQSDQVLFNGGSTDSIVSEYSRNPARFKSDFGSAMIKMGDIGLLTGSSGQIRRICSAVN
uniref:peroxidase n=1 Tax=Populus alba TaxID=43335 RepID=A0A4U5MBQ5_POPAL|nr:hypothetical protein D5086_0000310620 [Populus alba]